MLGGGIPRQSLRSWIEVLPGIDARLGQVGRAKAIPRDVLVERPPAAGDLFVLAYDEASRLYFETVLVKRKPRLLCQGQLFSLELEPEGAYPKLSELFVKGNPVLLAGLEEVRRMQKAGTSPAELVAELEERDASTPLARLPGYGDLRERVRAEGGRPGRRQLGLEFCR